MKTSLQDIAARLMNCPAAPYHEHAIVDQVLQFCREQKLKAGLDQYGNVLITLNRSSKTRPFVLAAHLDHPAFVIEDSLSDQTWRAEFRGGVADDYFRAGIKLRLYPGGVPARLGKRLVQDKKLFEIHSVGSPRATLPHEFAVWDLTPFSLKDDRIHGRACDDLIGAATVLDVLSSLSKSRARVNVIGVLSRAEEVGFHGALALAQSRKLPENSLVISLETSRELPGVRMGSGVIIRVGDRASTFDPGITRFLAETASDLQKTNSAFQFQRALMSGGTCEATAYQEFGYRCGAVCVALGNYHNCAPKNRIAAEFVSLADARAMSELLQSAALQTRHFEALSQRLKKRLDGYAREAVQALRRSSAAMIR